jgi:uncharacterized protein YidB (DUF937 family)
MSLFGEFAEQAIGAAIGGQGNTQQNQVVQALLQAISNHQGGLPGLLQEFESAGLAQHVASWIGNGENLPISADQLHQVLGSSAVSGIAAKLGIDPNQTAALAAQVLPLLVDKLTPAGAVTAEHSSAEGLLALAGQFFKS